MAKIRVYLEGDWYYWWEVSFDHYPFEYRHPDSVHTVHYYQQGPGWPWPEMIWYINMMREEDARLMAINCTRDPLYFADVCPFCNVMQYGVRYPRWNIHRGENNLWMPKLTILEPWPPE